MPLLNQDKAIAGMKKQSKTEMFHNERHKRDRMTGRIIKRDYSRFKAIECSLCHGPIKGKPSFSKHGKSNIVHWKGAVPSTDLGNVDYCEDCHIKLHTSFIKLTNKFKK